MKKVPATTMDVVEPILVIMMSTIDGDESDEDAFSSLVLPFKDDVDIETISDNNGAVCSLDICSCDWLIRCGSKKNSVVVVVVDERNACTVAVGKNAVMKDKITAIDVSVGTIPWINPMVGRSLPRPVPSFKRLPPCHSQTDKLC